MTTKHSGLADHQSGANAAFGGVAAKLVVAKALAGKHLEAHITRGMHIRRQKISNIQELEKARVVKQAWVTGYTTLLKRVFDTPAVADACNDYVGKIFPEYAHPGLFIDSFYEEIDHRLQRLQAVADRVSEMPDRVADLLNEPSASRPIQSAPAAPAREMEPEQDDGGHEAAAESDEPPSGQESRLSFAPAPAPAPAPPPPPAPVARPPATVSRPVRPNAQRTARGPQGGPGEPANAVARGLLVSVVKEDEAGLTVKKFLSDLGVDLVVLKSPGGGGSGLLESVEALEKTTNVSFALVSVGHDDLAVSLTDEAQVAEDGSVAEGGPCDRTAIFFMGLLVGKFSLRRVCVLHPAGANPAPDPIGVPHLPVDDSGGWQLQLARMLKRAGVHVDLNRLA